MERPRDSRKQRSRRLEAWFAAHLDERSPRAALAAIALFSLAGIFFLTGLKAAQDIFIDAAEAYAWGQSSSAATAATRR